MLAINLGKFGRCRFIDILLDKQKVLTLKFLRFDKTFGNCNIEGAEKIYAHMSRYIKKNFDSKAWGASPVYRDSLSLQVMTAIEEQKLIEEEVKKGRFVVHGDGTVTDRRTGLMWAARDNSADINWGDSQEYCQNYSGGGHADWRMPTQNELASLYDSQSRNKYGYKVSRLIDITACCLWAVEHRWVSQAAYFVFIDGTRGWTRESHSYNVRALPVRSVEKK